jgi:glycosyltransferase involved in cell wall biosynthesis
MIGRGNDKLKRFILGIIAMKFIIDEVSDSEMKIISNAQYIGNLRDIVDTFNLQNNVKFVGYTSEPEIYFKNSSIHIFPTVSESFGYVLCETKIYGIPNILLGLDYVSIAKGGTIIIYDDSPNTIGIEAIKILKKNKYKKELGREARKSMKPFNNQLLSLRWIKIILSIFNGNIHYQKINYFFLKK